MPLKSLRDDFEAEPEKVEQARAFCFQNGWIGVGWGIDGLDDNLTDPATYESALPQAFPETSARSAHYAIATRMLHGDFVWCRAKADIYWLARVEGPWVYRNVAEFADFDLYQVRQCEWLCVGPGDSTPGPVKNAFAGRGVPGDDL